MYENIIYQKFFPFEFLFFVQVFIDALEQSDLKFILNVQFPELSENLLDKMIQFNEELSSQIGITWGHSGSPWEMNLRDVTRWCEIMMANFKLSKKKIFNPGNGAQLIYINRMRTNEDKKKVTYNIFNIYYYLVYQIFFFI